MCILIVSGWILVVSYMIRMSSTYRVYNAMFFVSRGCIMCMSAECCKNISAIKLDIGDPVEMPYSGL